MPFDALKSAADERKIQARQQSQILCFLELGNEINGPFFNGNFLPAQASGRVLGISNLNNPNNPEGRAIAASYRAFLRVLEALNEVRDPSKLNQKTPLISAGLAGGGLPGKKPGQKLDGVSVPATLEFLRQSGLDTTAVVAQLAKERNGPSIRYQVLMYPSHGFEHVSGVVRRICERAVAHTRARTTFWLR